MSALSVLQTLTDSGKEMPRPRLPAGADTNAAHAYYELAEPLVRIGIKLDTAEMALYWASRLDPGWSDPIFARSLIPLDAITRDRFETWERTGSSLAVTKLALSEQQVRSIDSLQRVAWDRNPFFYSDLEFRRLLLIPGRRSDPARDGYLMFATRRFVPAESLFAIGLKKHPEDFVLRTYRARALFYLQQYDSVVVELEAARDTIRHRAVEHGIPIFLSVEMFEFAIGIARVQQDDFPAAKAAFERALTENLGFYWAHVRLAGAAIALHDTASAVSELTTAVEIEGRDPVLRMYYGAVLQSAGRMLDAEDQFKRAIGLDPRYAAPYYQLGVNYHQRGMKDAAIEQYRQFLARSARDDPWRPPATSALAALLRVAADSR
ncbi:MAG TPA: tetratricopeptide repeat protein [Gemmatimonadales bacterium]|nr:tetratricopeptide repeat protein [Gemmatimonadales bacterium]